MHAWHMACYLLLQGQGMTQLPSTAMGFPPHTAPLVSSSFHGIMVKKKKEVNLSLDQRFDFTLLYITSIVTNLFPEKSYAIR